MMKRRFDKVEFLFPKNSSEEEIGFANSIIFFLKRIQMKRTASPLIRMMVILLTAIQISALEWQAVSTLSCSPLP